MCCGCGPCTATGTWQLSLQQGAMTCCSLQCGYPDQAPSHGAAPDQIISFSGQLSSPVQALHRYQHLAALISGEEPRNLLQPAGQRRYLAQRIEELAQGTCVREFAWNSGGIFDGRPWSAELPSDADLVFYLVAAYMEVGVC